MIRTRSLLRHVVIVAYGLFAPAGLHAAELRWEAPEACPNAEAIAQDIEELIGQPLAEVPALGFAAKVDLKTPGHWQVVLSSTEAGTAAPGSRTIEGASCDDVSRAAVVAIALAINANRAAAEDSPTEVLPAAEPAEVTPAPRPSRKATLEPIEIVAFITGGAVLDAAAMPSVATGITLGGGLRIESFQVGLSGVFLPHHETKQVTSGARFLLAAGGINGCYRIRLGGWSAIPCARYEIGGLQGEGTSVNRPRSRVALWHAAEAQLAVGLPLRAHAELNLGGGLIVPFNRARFVLDSPSPIHEIPGVGGRGYLGLSWFF